MIDIGDRRGMRKAFVIAALLMSALLGAPALAAAPPTLELAAWVRSNTDLSVSQVAIAGPENVYSLEQLGPRLPTGEVLALVRTEAVSDSWRDAHQFQSWDAHMLMDCQGGRVRVLRSASYAERDRVGPAKADQRGDAWFEPQAETPAATLLAAACDANFSWPLRGSPAAAPSKATPLGGPSMLQTASAGAGSRRAAAITPVLVQTAVAVARAPAVQLAEVQPRLVLAKVEMTAAVETPQPKAVAAARDVAPMPTQARQAASLEAAQPGEPQNRLLQKVSFTPGPALPEPSFAAPQARDERPRTRVLATAASATKTCRRLVGAGRSWLWRRVEVALVEISGRPAPPVGPNVRT